MANPPSAANKEQLKVYSSKLWSSQLWTQFKQLRIEAWKSQNFNGVWIRDLAIPVRRSHQLSYEVTDVGNWSCVSSNEPVKNGCEVIYMKCFIYWTADLKSSELWSGHGFKLNWSPDFFRLLYAIAKIAFITAMMFRTHKWPAPNVSGLIAQFVRASHRSCKVTGSSSVEVLTF